MESNEKYYLMAHRYYVGFYRLLLALCLLLNLGLFQLVIVLHQRLKSAFILLFIFPLSLESFALLPYGLNFHPCEI